MLQQLPTSLPPDPRRHAKAAKTPLASASRCTPGPRQAAVLHIARVSKDSTQATLPRRGDDPRLVKPFLFMMGVYLCVVHLWTLFQYPLGRDFAALAAPDALPGPGACLFAWETNLFGAFPPGYHLVNLFLLYLCMCAIFFLTRFVTRGPWWLGSLAAVLTMANPLKAEATLNLCGVTDLAPALLALATLAFYTAHLRRMRAWKYLTALLLFTAAVFSSATCLGLVCALAACEYFLVPCDRRPERLVPFAIFALWALGAHHETVTAASLSPGAMLTPLAFVLYPIGVLPKTAALYHAHPMLGWLAATALLLCAITIGRAISRPAFWCMLIGAAAMRLFQGESQVDPVHLIGGGSMIVPIALIGIAVSTFCGRIIEHPKWHKPIVFLTTMLCIVFFLLHTRSNLAWRHAAHQVRHFQTAAMQATKDFPNETLAVAPDFQYFLGAPMKLSQSIAYATPFSHAIPIESVLPMHYTQNMKWNCAEWHPNKAIIAIQGPTVDAQIPAPYTAIMRYGTLSRKDMLTHWASMNDKTVWMIAPRGKELPKYRIPF